MSSMIDPILRSLHAIRRRMIVQAFLGHWVRWSLALAALLLFYGALHHLAFPSWTWDRRFGWAAAGLAAIGALVCTLAQRLTMRQAAQEMDLRAQTNDRVLTALSLAEQALSPMAALALRECSTFLAKSDFKGYFGVRYPKQGLWLLAPLISLFLLEWEATNWRHQREAAQGAAREEISQTVQSLKDLAKAAEKRGEENGDEVLKKLAEKLKESAEGLRSNATDKEQAAKAALRELSQLEQMLEQMQKSPGQLGNEELKQLAEALEKEESTKAAAEAIAAGNLADAAKALEEAAKEGGAGAADAALKEAIERLAQERQRSEALQKLAEQMQAEAGKEGKTGLQKLAQLLRELSQGQRSQPGSGGQKSRQQTLQQLLSALQNLKYGEPPSEPGKSSPGGEGPDGKVVMQSFPGAKPSADPQPGQVSEPTGLPGSEKDTGSSDHPFSGAPEGQGEKGAEVALKGRLGEGESLSALLPATGDQSQSSRRYKQLYEAIAPQAQDAVMQEEIPLGSRHYIKRYFEAIRPR